MAVQLIRQGGGGRQVIQAYGGGGFRVSGAAYRGSILVLPDATQAWDVAAFAALTPNAFAPLFARAAALDLCLVGCGARTLMLPAEVRAAARAAGLHLDVMDTGAACRTYNVLAAEGRALAAALIAV